MTLWEEPLQKKYIPRKFKQTLKACIWAAVKSANRQGDGIPNCVLSLITCIFSMVILKIAHCRVCIVISAYSHCVPTVHSNTVQYRSWLLHTALLSLWNGRTVALNHISHWSFMSMHFYNNSFLCFDGCMVIYID